MSSIDDLRKKWQSSPYFMRDVVAWEELPARSLRYGESVKINRRLATTLQKRGIQRLFNHQSIAVNAALRGENVVIATSTASGKSLCYTVPVFQRLLTDPDARALYLFPTKALTQDQQATTQLLSDEGEMNIIASVYDGDTPKESRLEIRRNSNIILTNPDMLHAAMLPYHTVWQDFWCNLAYVVIDELHIYRGIFGSHVANVMRRLQRVCQHYGSHPQFICCSATIANPKEHAERLFRQSFTLVGEEENGAPQQSRSFVIYNQSVLDSPANINSNAHSIMVDVLQAQLKTVVFARSRKAVEQLLQKFQPFAFGIQRKPSDIFKPCIAGYRGGYLPHERRRIESGLRDGSIQCVIATNALELGIDIGGLNAAILVGYPGSIASIWQQAGRAGRRDSSAIIVLIAGNSPLEQYLCRHPKYLITQSPEYALVNPDSFPLLYAHLPCAAYERPIHEDEFDQYSNDLFEMRRVIDILVAEGKLNYVAPYYRFSGSDSPAFNQSLRGASMDNFTIWSAESGKIEQIGEVDAPSAPMLIHKGAIYLHHGKKYLVEELDWQDRKAFVRPTTAQYRTEAEIINRIDKLEYYMMKETAAFHHAYGDVIVNYRATSYRKIMDRKNLPFTNNEIGYIDLPPWTLDTTGYWLKIKPIIFEWFSEKLLQLPSATTYYGPNWEKQRQHALIRDDNICQSCLNKDKPVQVIHVYFFEQFGYAPGVNDDYINANRLENLVVYCQECALSRSKNLQTLAALKGLAYTFSQLAPLFLMCDPRDIQVNAGMAHLLIDAPYLIIYEASVGVGFSAQLFDLHRELLQAIHEMVRDCPCKDGCPSCIGPTEDRQLTNGKVATKLLIDILIEVESAEFVPPKENTDVPMA